MKGIKSDTKRSFNNRPEEARRVLQRIRGPCHNIDDELEAIKASVDESQRELGVNQTLKI